MPPDRQKRILITGATGLLGTDCVAAFSPAWDVVGLARGELDITRADAIRNALAAHRPTAVLNCAAYTQVDKCETDRDTAMRVNAEAPALLAAECALYKAHFIHISTDYVFDGRRPPPAPYVEDDPTGPTSVYGESKRSGELAVLLANPESAIVRTSWVYGIHGNNFLKAVLGRARSAPDQALRVVNDQHGTPTWTVRLAEQLVAIADARLKGILHATGEGHCTWFEFARRFFDLMDVPTPIVPCTTAEFPRPAPRPANSILENKRLKAVGLNKMRPWEDDLAQFVKQYRDVLGLSR